MEGTRDRPRVVIVGGGVAGMEAALAVHHLAPGVADVSLIAPEPEFAYKPMVVDEPFSLTPAQRIALAPALEEIDVRYVPAAVTAVDAKARTVSLSDESELPYDKLVVALGGRARPAYARPETFWASRSDLPIDEVLERATRHPSRTLAFLVPPGTSWPLPIYELALMTRRRAEEKGLYGVRLVVATPEAAPLLVFGRPASDALADMLKARGVEVETDAYVVEDATGELRLAPGREPLDVGAAISLPTINGPRLPGLPMDDHGFIPIDEHARVPGVEDVYAAGDGTTFPIKQGGLATQQADAAIEHLAASLGAPVKAEPFHPVLRGKLLTGDLSLNLRHDVTGGHGEGNASLDYLWWPPHKIGGRYLAPWLAHTSPDEDLEPPSRPLDVEVSLPTEWHSQPMSMGSHPLPV